MLLCFFMETEYKLSSIRTQTPEHPSNFDTHQNTFCGSEENISLASSECANIPIPYLLLMRIEKKLYWVRKGSTKMGIVTLIWYSQINICSKSSHDRTAYESGNARIATVWQRVRVWYRSPSFWTSLTPPPPTKGHPWLAGQDELTFMSSMTSNGCAMDTAYIPICLLPDRLFQLGRHYKRAVVVQGEAAYTGYPSAPK